MTRELKIVRGVPRLSGDNLTNDGVRDVIDLMNSSGGYSLTTEGWIPALPPIEVQFLTSGLTDGGVPTASRRSNVTETIPLTAATPDLKLRYALLSKLNTMAAAATRFHISDGEDEPVYLQWWADGATAAQYSLIYEIDIAQTDEAFGAEFAQSITISVVREPFWRALAPGQPAYLYSKLYHGQIPGVDFTDNDLSFDELDHHMARATVYISYMIDPNDPETPLTANYIDIPKENIPGDAPALAQITSQIGGAASNGTLQGQSDSGTTIIWGRHIRPSLVRDYLGADHDSFLQFNGGDTDSDGPSVSKQSGATSSWLSNGSSSVAYRIEGDITANETGEEIATWSNRDINLHRGRHMIFARVGQERAVGTLQAQIKIYFDSVDNYFTSEWVDIPDVSSTYASDKLVPVLYFGTVDIPPHAKTLSSYHGRGLYDDRIGALKMEFIVRETAGTNTIVYFLDVGMIPIDDLSTSLAFQPLSSTGAASAIFIVDGTGYFTRGTLEPKGLHFSLSLSPPNERVILIPIRGQSPTVIPGVDNRYYMTLYHTDPGGDPEFYNYVSNTGSINNCDRLDVYIDLIPCWYGPRDDDLKMLGS